jgi:hypothetical protein
MGQGNRCAGAKCSAVYPKFVRSQYYLPHLFKKSSLDRGFSFFSVGLVFILGMNVFYIQAKRVQCLACSFALNNVVHLLPG